MSPPCHKPILFKFPWYLEATPTWTSSLKILKWVKKNCCILVCANDLSSSSIIGSAVAGLIVVVSILKCCALLHFVYDLKAAQMNRHCSQVQELMLYKFELGLNTAETTKNICCVKLITVQLPDVWSWSQYSNQMFEVGHSIETRCLKLITV